MDTLQKLLAAKALITSIVESQCGFSIQLLQVIKAEFPAEYQMAIGKMASISNDKIIKLSKQHGMPHNEKAHYAFVNLLETSLYMDSEHPTDEWNEMLNDFIESFPPL